MFKNYNGQKECVVAPLSAYILAKPKSGVSSADYFSCLQAFALAGSFPWNVPQHTHPHPRSHLLSTISRLSSDLFPKKLSLTSPLIPDGVTAPLYS